MTVQHVSEELWSEFHRVVNLSAAELEQWLATDAEEGGDDPADRDRRALGRHVARILSRSRDELTEADVEVMGEVVDFVRHQHCADLDRSAGGGVWRTRLLSVGHDPLRPLRARSDG